MKLINQFRWDLGYFWGPIFRMNDVKDTTTVQNSEHTNN